MASLAETRAQGASVLSHVVFDDGLEEFKKALALYRDDYLGWSDFIEPVKWIYDNIILSKSESSRSGNMELSVWQRFIAKQIVDPSVRQVTVLKGVQVGYSKFLKAIFAYVIAYLGNRVSIAFPTRDDVKRFYNDEISEMYKDVLALNRIVREIENGTARDSWYEQRFLNGARAYFRAAFNQAGLQGFTSWLNCADEVDRPGWLPGKDSHGSKLEQHRNRGTDFDDSKLIVGSTPGLRHSSMIWPEWCTSSKCRLFVKCPFCETEQVLRWGSSEDKTRYGFGWDLDPATGHVARAYYRCDSDHGCRIYEDAYDDQGRSYKEMMIEGGVFKATEVATVPGNVGVHVPSWISMSPGARWTKLTQEWVNAQDNTEKLKEFTMFKMAEPWDLFDSRIFNDQTLADTAVPYPAEVPDDVVVLTAGGDDQTNKEGKKLKGLAKIASRELSIYGWNRKRSPRLITHQVIIGEVGEEGPDAEYRAILKRPYVKQNGVELRVRATAMDMGGNHPDQTRIFANSFKPRELVWAIRGASPGEGKRLPAIWPQAATATPKGKNKFLISYTIDTMRARDDVAELLTLTGKDAPMFPEAIVSMYELKGLNFFALLTCEQAVATPNGGYHWTPKKGCRSEEEWACLVYAYVALVGLKSKHAGYRDLNVAARRLGISTDDDAEPDFYDGPDRSLVAMQLSQFLEPDETIEIPAPQPIRQVVRQERIQQPVVPAPVPAQQAYQPPQQQKPIRVRKSGRTIM